LLRIRVRTEGQKIPYFMVPGSGPDPMLLTQKQEYKHSACIVVESELDGIMLYGIASSVPGVTIVACGNTSVRPTETQAEFLKESDCILVAMDFDGKPGFKAWEWWQSHFDNAERWPVVSGKDPGESYKNGDDLREWIIKGLPPVYRLAVRGLDVAKAGQGREEGQKPAVKPVAVPAAAVTGGLCDKMQRLYGYLRKYPVKIVNTPVQLQLIFDRNWEDRHDAEAREISRLVYSDEGIEFFKKKTQKLIDRRNFM
ncbi:MAG: hypothetical protein WCQ99_15930, partial [Pseudomonadota bacterium]